MNVRLAIALSLAVAAVPMSASTAAPSIDALTQRHIQALGGAAAVASIHSFVTHGWYKEGSFRLDDTYVAQMRPFYRVIGSPKDPLGEIHEGYDGSAWEYYPDPGIVVRTIGQPARTARQAAQFDDPLVGARAHGIALTYRGEQTFYGNPAFVIHVRLADGFEEDYFLDRRTYLIDGRAEVVPMHAFGTRYHTLDVYGDYRSEGGVMFHHSDREVDSATGTVLDEGGVTSVDINPDLPLESFSPPVWNRTPLQQMIQRMYDERDETAAVMATYRDFGSLVDVKAGATADAVDFTGYQILKMGHADTAVALLSENVAVHPRSARCRFGLGRALLAAGDRTGARREFESALSIDPKYDRAAKALNDLRNLR